MSNQRIDLNSPDLTGRLRQYERSLTYRRRPVIVKPRTRLISDFLEKNPDVSIFSPPSASQYPQISTFIPDASIDVESQAQKQNTRPQNDSVPEKLKVNLVALGLIVVLFVFGVGVALVQLRTNEHVVAQVGQATSEESDNSSSSDSLSDETEPSNMGAYTVPPDQPRYIRIPKLDVYSRVRKLGVKTNNELMTPNNIYDTGWYEDSAKPGDKGGAILIDGHVHGPTKPGVFYGLKTLVVGDSVQIERGDGQKYNFKVVKLQTYEADKVDMAAALTPVVPGKLGLNLITCAGQLDGSRNHYQERLVVFTTAE